jgi:hypothetical protein
MRTLYPLVLVVALGLSTMLLVGSGAADYFQQSQNPTTLADSVEKNATSGPVGGEGEGSELSGSAESENNPGSIVGLVIAGSQLITSFVSLVTLLPFKLQQMGFPYWAAYPVGLSVQLLASISVIQFVSGRVLR